MGTVALGSSAGRWIMISAILASAMAFIDSSALNVVLPALQKDLHASGTDLFWVLNAYLLMLASLVLIGGALGDKLGRKKIFMVGIFVFMIGSAACGFSADVFFLIGFRALQGAGGALMIPGSLSLISSGIADEEKGKAIGTWSALTTIVTMGGPILGGALADIGLWRYIFFINIPIGCATVVMLWFYVAETKEPDSISRGSLDLWGAITLAVGLALITFGFLRIPVLGLFNVQTIGTLSAGFGLLIVFLTLERRVSNPMMPLRLFSNSTFSGANLLTFFLYAGLGSGLLFLSLNLVQAQGYTQLQSGLTFLPFTVLMVLLARFAGRLADKYGARLFLIAGPAVAGTGLLMLSFIRQTGGFGEYWTTFFPGILVLGLGMSLTVAPLTTAVMGSVGDEFSGTASGINNAMTRISTVFANAIFGAFAVVIFSGFLSAKIEPARLSMGQRSSAMHEAVNLGNARTPSGLLESKRSLVAAAYRSSFIQTYDVILRISAGLAYLGTFLAVIFIKPLTH